MKEQTKLDMVKWTVFLGHIICVLIFIQLVSAETIYAGENITIQSDFEIVDCSIINNTYNLDGLNLTWDKDEIFISTVPNFKSDNFSVSCKVIKYKEKPPVHYSFGGGSSTTTQENETEVVEEINETESDDEIILDEKKNTTLIIIFVFVGIFIIGIIIYLIYNSRKKEENFINS